MTDKIQQDSIKDIAASLETVRDFLRYATSAFTRAELFFGHGTFTPHDEAAYLVLQGLDLPVDELEIYLDARLLPRERERLAGFIDARIKTRKPLAYILKRAWLAGVPFYVDERVIVPRSYIAELLNTQIVCSDDFAIVPDPYEISSVLDLCTGSGCLAILAAHTFPDATVDAADLSPEALEVAKINVDDSLHKDRITLYQGDLFAPLQGKKYDLIITNPPYVDAEDMTDMPPEYLHEPRMALAAGDDGLDLVRRILREAPDHLNEGGIMVLELGYSAAALVEQYPDIDFQWLDTENSTGEVFWVTREQLVEAESIKAA
ncbi:MAG: 50S ribosomal protein L3 N(5)-glutamine methyltransferase [Alphaproteobacteria bacterium]